jgi:DnaK suppressor protein
MNELSEETLHDIRQDLINRREALFNDSQSTQSEIREGDQDIGGRDTLDESTSEQGITTQLRFADRDRKLIHKIDAALERINDGEYGICEVCGEAIGEKRLRARPMTTMCIDCKEDQEKQEAREKTRPGLIDED